MKLLIKCHATVLGGHTHVDFFVGEGEVIPEQAFSFLGQSGTLILRNSEWEKFKVFLTSNNPDCIVTVEEVSNDR